MNISPLTYLAGIILIGTLSALAWIDWKTFRLPNVLTFPLIIGGLGYNAFTQASPWPYLLGAVCGYLAFLAIELAYKALRKKDGLGRGDAKLLAAGGAWCGAIALPYIVLLASSSAIAYIVATGKYKTAHLRLPFGPFLVIGIASIWLAQSFTSFN